MQNMLRPCAWIDMRTILLHATGDLGELSAKKTWVRASCADIGSRTGGRCIRHEVSLVFCSHRLGYTTGRNIILLVENLEFGFTLSFSALAVLRHHGNA